MTLTVFFGHIIKMFIIMIVLMVIVVFSLCVAAGQQAETGSAVAGKRRGTGGQRAPQARTESAATHPSGAETLKRPSLTETETERGNERERESRRGRKRKAMMRKKKRNY